MPYSYFTSEAVSKGHPDKIADQIADRIVDGCLAEDATSKVGVEVLASLDCILIAGEITSKAALDYQKIAHSVLKEIGYTVYPRVECALKKQSEEVAGAEKKGASDQAVSFGYATDETNNYMPLPINIAYAILRTLEKAKKSAHLMPDAKVQITCQYDEKMRPFRIHSVLLSCQHKKCDRATLHDNLLALIKESLPAHLVDEKTCYYINPSGSFIVGGLEADTGLTGRKQIADTYGGQAREGGGSFSGKDPTKIDRLGAYAARYIAKNLVAAKIAKRIEVQLAYGIGIDAPINVDVDTFGTGIKSTETIRNIIKECFDLRVHALLKLLDLQRPIYSKTSYGGHFGRDDPDFSWETLDSIDTLKACILKF